MKATVTWNFFVAGLVAGLALAAAITGMRISAAANPQVKSGVDRL